MFKINFRSVQIISLSVLILFSSIFIVFFSLFYDFDRAEVVVGESEESGEITVLESHKEKDTASHNSPYEDNNSGEDIGDPDEPVDTEITSDTVFDSDAVIIIPGITGSELVSAEDYVINDNVSVNKGDLIWLPFEILELREGLDITGTAQDYLDYMGMSLEMLGMNDEGDTIFSIAAKKVSDTDLTKGTLGSATELYNKLYEEYSDRADVIFYGYDWRFSCVDIAKGLEDFINSQGYENVTLVCHSMGGIVAAHYLDRSDENIEKTDKVITIGTPFGGSVKALMALQNGRFIELGIFDSLIKRLSYNMQSIYELLPNKDYVSSMGGYIYDDTAILDFEKSVSWYSDEFRPSEDSDNRGVNMTVYNKAILAQNRLFNDGLHIMNDPRIDVCMISGYDLPTVQKVYESDDYISQISENYAGDGTVSIDSSVKSGGEYFDNPIYFVRGAEHRLMLLNNNVIDLTISAINNGSDIDLTGFDTDNIKTPDTLEIKNDGAFEIKEVEESYLGIAFEYLFDNYMSKEGKDE